MWYKTKEQGFRILFILLLTEDLPAASVNESTDNRIHVHTPRLSETDLLSNSNKKS